MVTLELFRELPDRFLDPRVRYWNNRLSEGGVSARLEVDWPAHVVGQTRPEMTILESCDADADAQSAMKPVLWDDELNDILLAKSIRAVDRSQEVLRFSLVLRSAFRRASLEGGDGFFNAIFFQVLKDVGLAEDSELKPLVDQLDYIHIIEKSDPDGSYNRCYAMIRSALQIVASDLIQRLGYTQPEAEGILVAALVDYIDRRFSVSIRRQRGYLRAE